MKHFGIQILLVIIMPGLRLRVSQALDRVYRPCSKSFRLFWIVANSDLFSVLMEWAECGSLDDLIDARQGKKNPIFDTTVSGETNPDENETTTRSARIRAFKAAKKAQVANGTGSGSKPHSPIAAPGILLLSAEEIMSYLSDIVSGLAFLVGLSLVPDDGVYSFIC